MDEATYDNAAAVTAATRAAMDVHGWGRNECVIGGRASLEIGRRLGWRARPLTVAVYVTAPDAKVASGTHGTGSLTLTQTPTSREDGFFDTTWDGHLITLFEQRWAADVTADQFSRPDHNLTLNAPILIDLGKHEKVRDGFCLGGQDPDAGLTITYKVIRDDMVWGQEYWWNADCWEPVVDTAMDILNIDQET